MTSTNSMRTIIGRLMTVTVFLFVFSCTPKAKIATAIHAPYYQDQIWAVAPFMNESGISTIRVDAIADSFAEQAQHVKGINVVPVNRVILAMTQLKMKVVSTVAEAEQLLSILNVDGLILGSITAYDPYSPPTLGIAIQLYMAPDVRFTKTQPDDVVRAPSDQWMGSMQVMPHNPVAQAAGVFDAIDNRTIQEVKQYAESRHISTGAYGTSIYLVSMDLYTEFVAHRLINELLSNEKKRLMAGLEGDETP